MQSSISLTLTSQMIHTNQKISTLDGDENKRNLEFITL